MMNKHKLHQWLTLLIALVIFAGCSKKNFPDNAASDEDKYEIAKPADNDYSPPLVINISDELAKSNKEGEMYYDNEYGYRYWKFCDGKYYLDTKYETGAKPDKKITKKQNKKRSGKNEDDGYVNQ